MSTISSGFTNWGNSGKDASFRGAAAGFGLACGFGGDGTCVGGEGPTRLFPDGFAGFPRTGAGASVSNESMSVSCEKFDLDGPVLSMGTGAGAAIGFLPFAGAGAGALISKDSERSFSGAAAGALGARFDLLLSMSGSANPSAPSTASLSRDPEPSLSLPFFLAIREKPGACQIKG